MQVREMTEKRIKKAMVDQKKVQQRIFTGSLFSFIKTVFATIFSVQYIFDQQKLQNSSIKI